MDDDHSDAQRFAGLTGIVLTGVIIYFCVQLASTANIDKYNPNPMAPLYWIYVASVVGPLLLLNISMTAYLLAKKAASPGLLALMWGAPIIASMTHPFLVARDHGKRDALERAHPAITEHHANLTGRTFWLTPAVSKSPVEPGAFAYIDRKQTLEKHDDPMAEYAGERLAPGFKWMKIFLSEPTGAPGTMKPVRPGPWPNLSAVDKPDGSGTTSVIAYHYFHYPDRVEVVPTFGALATVYRTRGLTGPLLDVYPHNLSGATIARLQIDGQEVGLLDAVAPSVAENCIITPGAAINTMAAPLMVRWQNAQPGSAWQEATVSIPPFQQARAGKDAVRSNAVHLYFLADSRVAAQRVQEIIIDEGRIGVRITEPGPALATPGVCGTASATYDGTFERMGT